MAPATISPPEPDYYEFLSISSSATQAEISRAYRLTNLKYHPDKFKPTAELSAAQAATNLDLLQKIVQVLKDPAERQKYDQGREARLRREAEKGRLEEGRRRMREDLEKREMTGGEAPVAGGVKRNWAGSEREEKAKRIAEENRRRKEEMMMGRKRREEEDEEHRQQQRLREQRPAPEKQQDENEAQARFPASAGHAAEAETDAIQRSVKVTWIREGPGLDIDQSRLEHSCSGLGSVEHVVILKDKKKRLDGRKEKSIVGSGLVVFASISDAKKAVDRGPWDGIESVSWAAGERERGAAGTEPGSMA